jgi:prolycopene isomerase
VAQYDVIVVGAGLGGMSAALHLAQRGRKVLLLERHNIPGGYATSFVRGRFEFEIALHQLSDIGSPEHPGFLKHMFDALGLSEHLDLVSSEDFLRVVYPGLDATLPLGLEPYTERVCELFPLERRGIRAFMDLVHELGRESDALAEIPRLDPVRAALAVARLPFRLRRTPRYLFATWGDVLDGYVSDPMARAVLSQIWGYFGLPPSRCSFVYFALAQATLLRYGVSYVKGRSQALSSAFVARLEALGGEARMGTGAARVEVAGGRVSAVITDQGERLPCRAAVANLNPLILFRDLVGMGYAPPAYRSWLSRLEVGPSSVLVFAGLARSLVDEGRASAEVIWNRDADQDAHHHAMQSPGPPGNIMLSVYNAHVPEISPPGTSLVSMTSLSYGQGWRDVAPEDYVDTKSRMADAMLDAAETVYPGFRESVEVLEVSTPLTNIRYAGTLGGAIYGFGNDAFSHSVLRPPPVTPIPGLYLAGASTFPGGGFSPCMLSGMIAGGLADLGL